MERSTSIESYASGGELGLQDGWHHPATAEPGEADAEPALWVKVVRLVRRSTLTQRAEPASTVCGSTATGWLRGWAAVQQ